MAYFATVADFFSTASGLLALTTSDRTVMAWVRTRTIVAGQYRTLYVAGGAFPLDDSEGGLFTGGASGANPEQFQERPAGFFVDALANPIAAGSWDHYAWVKSGTTHRFLVNGVLALPEYTFDLAGAPTPAVTAVEALGSDGITLASNHDILYFRAWNTSLADADVQAEMASPTVVQTFRLWRDTPLVADGQDISGNARHWTTHGTPTFPPDTPFPDTSDPADAVDLGTLPVAYAATVGAQSLFNLWYKFTTPATIKVAGIFVYGDATNYQPSFQLYTGTPGSLTLYWDETFIAGDPKNKATQANVSPATTYYLKVLTNFPAADAATPLSISILVGPNFNVGAGDIFIVDDFQITPAVHPNVFLSGTTGAVINFQSPPFASGLGGDILPSGVMLFSDDPNTHVRFYNADFTSGPTFAYGRSAVRANPVANNFYVSVNGAAGSVKVIDATGVQTTAYAFGTGGLTIQALAAANDQSVLYYSLFSLTNSALKRITLPGLAPLADLAPNAAGWHLTSLLVLSDTSVLSLYHENGGLDAYVNRYSAAGVQLQTFLLGPTIEGYGEPVLGSDDNGGSGIDTTFWVLTHHTDNVHRLRQIRLADGVVLKDFAQPEYEEGVYSSVATPTPTPRFGPPGSCPFLVLRSNNVIAGGGQGSLEVRKVTVPGGDAQTFDFATTGLDPVTFTLVDGGSQLYDPLAPGSGYAVAETPVVGWATSYAVNNGSPIANLTVANGEHVVVTVTNRKAVQPPTPVCPPRHTLAPAEMGCIMPVGDF